MDEKKNLIRFLYTGCRTDCSPFKVLHNNDTIDTPENCSYLSDDLEKIDDESIVDWIKAVAEQNDFYNNDILLLALAACTTSKPTISAKAYSVVKDVCLTSKSILQFVCFCQKFSKLKTPKEPKGWGRLRRRTVQQWYGNKRPYKVAFDVTSCQSYNHWRHEDLLKLCHMPLKDAPLGLKILCSYLLFGFEKTFDRFEVAKAEEDADGADLVHLFTALKQIKSLKPVKTEKYVKSSKSVITISLDALTSNKQLTTNPTEPGEEVAKCMIANRLSWNHLPCQWHNDAAMWKHLINYVDLEILLKNLPRLHNIKILENDGIWQKCVVERILSDTSLLHPMTYFWYREKYNHKHHIKKKYTWKPNVEILSALDVAFYASIKHVKPMGKHMDIVVDVKLSSDYLLNSQYHSCDTVAAALCYVLLATEDQCEVKRYQKKQGDGKVNFSKENDTIASIKTKLMNQRPAGKNGIDFALPLIHAKKEGESKNNLETLIIITDAPKIVKTGPTSPLKAFKQCQAKYPEMRLITIALCSDSIPVNDVKEFSYDILDIAGFDDKVPPLIRNFSLKTF